MASMIDAMPRRVRAARLGARLGLVAGLVGIMAGCHGGTLDSVYPGELGHTPPPAVNLPPQDAGMEHR